MLPQKTQTHSHRVKTRPVLRQDGGVALLLAKLDDEYLGLPEGRLDDAAEDFVNVKRGPSEPVYIGELGVVHPSTWLHLNSDTVSLGRSGQRLVSPFYLSQSL